jgi:glycosyltransferase involved in cell wall biosynthesis
MNNQNLLSVIVPIYKIDQYLGICIESLIRQTHKNLEIILVDDGSPDRCPEICDLYAKKDVRIKVTHKTNGGLVSARKAGLSIASGEYVGYVDGDDWAAPAFCENMMKRMFETDSDLVISGYSRDLFSSSSTILNHIPVGVYAGEELKELRQNMLSFGEFYRIGISTYVWNKIFKRDLLIKHQNAVSDLITIGEDAAVVYPYLMDCKKVCVTNYSDYHYRQREDSMLKKSSALSGEIVRLKILYNHLQEFATNFDSIYNLKAQVDDFLLSICTIRSGGIHREIPNYLSPFGTEFKDKRVLIWSAGTFGQQLVNRIKENEYCDIVAWLDEDYWEYRRCCMDVDPIDTIDNVQYDYVLIAAIDGKAGHSIKAELIHHGVPGEKILTVHCPKEKRHELLTKYLNITPETQE